MIEIDCPLCGSAAYTGFISARDHIRHDDRPFDLVKCAACGLVYLNPQPDGTELSQYYAGDYRQWQEAPSRGLAARVRRMGARRKLREVAGLVATGRIIDIGCGGGDFLREAGEAGWHTAGTEFDSRQAEKAAAACGADVRAGGAVECGFEPGTFDVATMWHVLEHMARPLETLEGVGSLLVPGGMLVVALPDSGSWAASAFGEYWAGYDVPRHLCDFTSETLSCALARTGFDIERVSRFMGTFDNVLISLEFLIEDRVRRPAARKIALALVRNPVTRVLATPLALTAQKVGLGTVVTVFARKRMP